MTVLRRVSTAVGRRCAATLTRDRYPHIERRTNLAAVNDHDCTKFEAIVGKHNVLTSDLDGYNEDWLGIYKGGSSVVVRPGDESELAAVMQHCQERRLPVCIQSGNTSLVGGSVPVHDELVLSLSRLTQPIDFDEDTGVMSAPAGHTLQSLDETIAAHGFMMPLDLGAKGSCMIGGNVSTAAGGIRFVRYGSLHAHLLGVNVVNARGEVVCAGSGVRKDNTGLHLPHLYCGSEGQLGIITRVTMTTVPRPQSVNVAMLGVQTFDACLSVLRTARRRLGEILSSFEFMDDGTMQCVRENLSLASPLDQHPFYLLIETHGCSKEHDEEKMSLFVEECMEKEYATDGVLSTSESQSAAMWALRESAAEALKKDGHTYKQDLSVPLRHFYELCEMTRERLKGTSAKRCVLYGHFGDGNAHLNITSGVHDPEIDKRLYPHIYEWVSERGGSISAEHGIGFAKRPYIHYSQSAMALKVMGKVKEALDQYGILNPYKTLP